MLRVLTLALTLLTAAAIAQTPPGGSPSAAEAMDGQEQPPAEPSAPVPATNAAQAPAPAPKAKSTRAPKAADKPAEAAAAEPSASGEQSRFEQYRRDLINLLALRTEPDLLVAAAELAYPDTQDSKRPAALKSPALIKRAQKFGPDVALVWWISTFLDCPANAAPCHGEPATKLEQLAGDNAAVWLPSLHAAKDPAKQRELLGKMAQAQRFDDYWSASVAAMFRALQTLPVPEEVLGHGLNSTAARINLATSVGGAFVPNYARLGEMCQAVAKPDDAQIGDCLALARLLENGGSFRSQSVGFAIEDSLLPAGTARDLLRAHQRSSAWQKEQFLELSARFPRDETLAKTYTDLLRENNNEMTTVVALLRNQHQRTDPPAGWQPQARQQTEPVDDPLAAPPVH